MGEKKYFLLNCESYGIVWNKNHWEISEFAEPLLKKNRWAMSYFIDQNGDRITNKIWNKAKAIRKGDVVFFYTYTRQIYAYGYVINKREHNNEGEIPNVYHTLPLKGNEPSGFVKGTVFFVDRDCEWPHQMEVDYLRKVKDTPINCTFTLGNGDTIKELKTKFLEEAENIMKEIDNQDFYQNFVSVVKNLKNIILSGAPGTGKTFIANEIAKRLTGDDGKFIEFVQFHPSYDYSDFMEGLVPTKDAGKFEYREGIFKKFCRDAAEKWNEEECNNIDIESRKKFVFIIDEINRGEVSKIFGEAFNSVEPSQRGKAAYKVKTQYHDMAIEFYSKSNPDQYNDVFKDGFYVPENVFIVATMNDIDRSVEILDFAFRRRFPSWEITYESTIEAILSSVLDKNKEKESDINKIKESFKGLNDAISKDDYLGPEYCLGGAYLNNLPKVDFDKEKLWKYFLEPVLKEYLRGLSSQKQKEKLEEFDSSFFKCE